MAVPRRCWGPTRSAPVHTVTLRDSRRADQPRRRPVTASSTLSALVWRVGRAVLPDGIGAGGTMAVAKRYRVTLTAEERDDLRRMISRGKADARKLAHARILLQADEAEGGPARVDEGIASALEVSVRTIERVRQRFVEQGLAAALLPKPSARLYARKLDGEQEAHLLALACTRPPEGKARWSLRLLAERMVELEHVDGLSHETVRRTLKKTSSSRT